jgi:hypothetical protein
MLLRLSALVAITCLGLTASDDKDIVQTVQSTFDAMAAKDAAQLKKLFLADARLIAVRETDQISNISAEQFTTRISAIAEPILERMWNPKVTLDGKLAVLWAEYDFHRSAKFTHCGIDIVNLVKTAEGWKISTIQYSVQTTGCKPSPLGPPKP